MLAQVFRGLDDTEHARAGEIAERRLYPFVTTQQQVAITVVDSQGLV